MVINKNFYISLIEYRRYKESAIRYSIHPRPWYKEVEFNLIVMTLSPHSNWFRHQQLPSTFPCQAYSSIGLTGEKD